VRRELEESFASCIEARSLVQGHYDLGWSERTMPAKVLSQNDLASRAVQTGHGRPRISLLNFDEHHKVSELL
jgi:hypothetical protein